jgi:hypothetical protein
MKKLISAIFLFFILQNLNAQQKFLIGPKFGLNINTQTSTEINIAGYTSTTGFTNYMYRPLIGLFSYIRFIAITKAVEFGLQPEILATIKGGASTHPFKVSLVNPDNPTPYNMLPIPPAVVFVAPQNSDELNKNYELINRLELAYAQIPILARAAFFPNTKLFLTLGPALGVRAASVNWYDRIVFETDANRRILTSKQEFGYKSKWNKDILENLKDIEIEPIELSLIGGLGVAIPMGKDKDNVFTAEIRADYGLTNAYTFTGRSNIYAKNLVYQFQIGFGF